MNLKKLLVMVCASMLMFGIAACESKGPVEKVGEKIDRALENAGDKMEETGEAIKDTAEDAEKKLKKATD